MFSESDPIETSNLSQLFGEKCVNCNFKKAQCQVFTDVNKYFYYTSHLNLEFLYSIVPIYPARRSK